MTDELDIPLGQRPPKPRRPLPVRFSCYAIAAALVAAVAGFAGWTILAEDPLGGEPFAIAAIDKPASPVKTGGAGEAADKATAPAMQNPSAVQTVTVIDGMSGKRQQFTVGASGEVREAAETGKVVVTPMDKVSAVSNALQALAPPAKPVVEAPAQSAAANKPEVDQPASSAPAVTAPVDPRLVETSRHGAIPKIGPGNLRPSEVYASPLAQAAAAQSGAKIAIVIGRMGISARGTGDALTQLPAAISVAFAPYGANLDVLAARARAGGREVLLQVPMEPFEYPDNDPGPKTLLTSLSPDQNIDRLHWFMSRFSGYVGIANYMGMRFAANEPAVSTVMRELAHRGLLYFDDGRAARSLVAQVAAFNNVPFARADIVIDAGHGAAEIDAALARLEAMARERGSAVGTAIALPTSIEHIARWAAGANARGITLVPISVIANRPRSS